MSSSVRVIYVLNIHVSRLRKLYYFTTGKIFIEKIIELKNNFQFCLHDYIVFWLDDMWNETVEWKMQIELHTFVRVYLKSQYV